MSGDSDRLAPLPHHREERLLEIGHLPRDGDQVDRGIEAGEEPVGFVGMGERFAVSAESMVEPRELPRGFNDFLKLHPHVWLP